MGCTLIGTAAIWHGGIRGPGATPNRFSAYPFLDMWIRWDAGWYYSIAAEGYYFDPQGQSSVAFFPLYPLLMRGLKAVGVDPLIGGMASTLACGLAAAILFAAWSSKWAAPGAVQRASWLIWLWPFSFFLFGAVYSDALFLALVLGAFLSLEHRRPWAAAVLGGLATACRPVAPAVVVGLLLRQLELRRAEGRRFRAQDLVPLFSAAGALAYLLYLRVAFDDPLAFLRTQVGWGQLGGPSSLAKLALFKSGWSFDSLLLPVLHAALALAALALVLPIQRKLGTAYAAYVAIAVGMPLLSSRDFIGLGRYALAAFPSFLVASMLLDPRPTLRRIWFVASGALLALMTIKFAVGRYVS